MPGLELFGDLGIWGSRLSWALDCWVQVLGFGLRVNPGQRAHGIFVLPAYKGTKSPLVSTDCYIQGPIQR